MKIDIIHSGSDGNATVVSDGKSNLLLDAGLSYRRLSIELRRRDALPVDGVLITHEHGDHVKAVGELARRGFPVYMSPGTFNALHRKIKATRSIHLCHTKFMFECGTFDVRSIPVIHDAADPVGYLFQSRVTNDRGVYVVDSGRVDYTFRGVTHWIIEANYTAALLNDNGKLHPALKRRIKRNHFSVESLIEFFADQDMTKTRAIHLVHLSSANSNEREFIQRVQRATGVPVYTENETMETHDQN